MVYLWLSAFPPWLSLGFHSEVGNQSQQDENHKDANENGGQPGDKTQAGCAVGQDDCGADQSDDQNAQSDR